MFWEDFLFVNILYKDTRIVSLRALLEEGDKVENKIERSISCIKEEEVWNVPNILNAGLQTCEI